MAKFTDDEINLAKEVQAKYGVPASVTLAQYALESGYGKHTVGKNNYFNIKGKGQGGYRDYESKRESFLDFGALLSSERYTQKTAGAKTVDEYVSGVKAAGYAEDPAYVKKVLAIIKGNHLTDYDTGEIGSIQQDNSSKSKIGLNWWGDIVRVVLILLLIGAGVVIVAASVGGISPKK